MIRFVKFQALGNDYIVFEAKALRAIESLNDFATQICQPHYGAGADGIAVLEAIPSEAMHETNATDKSLIKSFADFRVRIFNPDGSEAGLSGNGTRCAAAYLYQQGLWHAAEVRLQTPTRQTLYRLAEVSEPGQYVFESELGCPTFDAASIPINLNDAPAMIKDFPVMLASGALVRVTALSVGNPHCATFVEDFQQLDWRAIGAELERHTLFPERTNVEFIRVIDNDNIELRIWERGVGETHSSGTCASASVIACAVNERTTRRINVTTQGGTLKIEWRATDDVIVLTGGADVVYEGVWLGRSVERRNKNYDNKNEQRHE